MSPSVEYESFCSPLPIPGGDGTLVLPTVAPNLFSIVLDSGEDGCLSMDGAKPRIRVRPSRDKKLVICIENPSCPLEESSVTVSSSPLNVFDAKMEDERTHDVRRGSDMKEVLVDIHGDPFIYLQNCWVSQKELEDEVETLFGCELFHMPHIRNILVKDMARIAVDFKSMISTFPLVDPKEVRRQVMGNYIASMPRSKIKKLLF
ncbi:Uncharacterized protein Fot_38217 [Forsythia ovata]|uniref:Uncharacterized protein n=1 Tax=Forsythia ovata TaxID=205694 RepID=A0ABD1S197_9LAMI